ncbi:MAG: PTS glucitol/sorbitol transporter subunit IIC [Tessaracoccus sp.]|uniref:PTS glucitol/sorbitol transporter subunit IIC n=1 Tax=Tessaracoccus sp. TaxID=1971211 RepID=UPI001EBF2F34|nr:PTS glucitol/sorbitol transporter subunit IIC [Tessaracoccus sp.]MBK7822396.1 PTS glucitol/sorbitol transporter subunit IIC [Tessaracoccus sp.]
MQWLVAAAEWFVGLFQAGGEVFISMMTGIVPVVLVLLVAMNSVIALVGEDKINKLAQGAGKNVVSRYLVLPFVASFLLCNPMAFTMGRFLPERYKPGYYASTAQFCHTSLGIFPHINPGELFTWMGIASGIMALGLNQAELAIRYLLVGAVLNFLGGWVTDFTTAFVEKQQGITLKREVHANV